MSLTALFVALAALAPPPETPVREVPLASLIGKSEVDVAAGLGLTATPAWSTQFTGRVDDGPLSLAKPDLRGVEGCDGLPSLRPEAGTTYIDYFVFRAGRLVAVVGPRSYPRQPMPRTAKAARQEANAARKRPAGPLPLSSGVDGYLSDLQGRALPAGETLRLTCRPMPVLPPPGAAKRSVAQDILAAPFIALSLAYWSPVYAAQAVDAADRRATARENGPLVAGLKLGEAPPGGEAEFRRRNGVRWHQDPDKPGYAVVTLDLGADHGRERRFTTFGVRDGRVEWIGLADRGLCQDAERRPSAARKGCTETGHYNP